MSENLSLVVEGMQCAGCAGKVERALNAVEGVEARVNIATHTARLDLARPDLLAEAMSTVRHLGYAIAEEQVGLSLEGMHCAGCAAKVERRLETFPGVKARVNFATRQVQVSMPRGTTSVTTLIGAVRSLGYDAAPLEPAEAPRPTTIPRADLLRFAVTLGLAVPLFWQMGAMLLGGAELPPVVQLGLGAAISLGCAAPIHRRAYRELRSLSPGMDTLVSLGVLVAFGFGLAVFVFKLDAPLDFETGAAIVTFVLFGRMLEARVRRAAGAGLAHLWRLQPEIAHVVKHSNGQDEVQDHPTAAIRPGDILQIRAGERVPVDAIVLEGHSALDEAMLTGESLPQDRGPGDRVLGGTLNTHGVLRVRAEATGQDSALARIAQEVAQAQGTKAPVQRLADRVAGVFVPGVLALALGTFLLGWAIRGAWMPSLFAAIGVLVAACPCALGLATPVAIMVGTARAASLGIVFRTAEALEVMHRLDLLAFDKTGTLTQGHFTVTELACADGVEEKELLSVAASLEAQSEHPLACAIVQRAHDLEVVTAQDVCSFAGEGLSGTVGGAQVLVGTVSFLRDSGVVDVPQEVLAGRGCTIAAVARNGRYLGALGLADAPRTGAAAMIGRLQALGLHVAMLTGDHAEAARPVAGALGIADMGAGLSPQGKAARLREWRGQGRVVGMVGDGINDAPALAAADIGVAIGSGTAVAIETADVVLTGGNPLHVAEAWTLSRATYRVIRQNLGFAFGYNLIILPLAACGALGPALASAAMAASSVCVVLNALRLRRLGLEINQRAP